MAEISDEQLILEFQAGNKDCISMIFERYKTPIFNFCLRYLGNRPDAEDAVGDVFLKLFSHQYTFDPGAKFSTWIYIIARNSCIDKLRKKKFSVSLWFTNREDGGEEQWDIQDPSEASRDQLAQKEAAQSIRAAIRKLPLEQKEALILREYQGLAYEEIAKVTGCSLEKTKVLIFRARENLRQELSSLIQEVK